MSRIVAAANGKRPPFVLWAGECVAISAASYAHGATGYISPTNFRSRAFLVLRTFPLAATLIRLMLAMSHM